MKQIGIRLADGSFYPIMEDGKAGNKNLGLTTVRDNQTRIVVDLYRSSTGTMEDAEYIDSLQIDNLNAHPNGSVDIPLKIKLDENNKLSADMNDPETGATSNADITLVSRTLEERLEPTNYDVKLDGTTASDATMEEPEISDDTLVSDDFNGEEFELPEDTLSDADFDLPDDFGSETQTAEMPAVDESSGDSLANDDFALPDSEAAGDEPAGNDLSGDTLSSDDFALPDDFGSDSTVPDAGFADESETDTLTADELAPLNDLISGEMEDEEFAGEEMPADDFNNDAADDDLIPDTIDESEIAANTATDAGDETKTEETEPEEKSGSNAGAVAAGVAAGAVGGGLLARMMAKRKEEENKQDTEVLSDAMASKADAIKGMGDEAEYDNSGEAASDTIDFPETADESDETVTDSPADSFTDADSGFESETSGDSDTFAGTALPEDSELDNNLDFNFGDEPADAAENGSVGETSEEDPFALPDMDEDPFATTEQTDGNSSDKVAADETQVQEEDPFALPDLDDNAGDTTVSDTSADTEEDPFGLPDLDENAGDATAFDNSSTTEEDPFALPDLDENAGDTTVVDNPSESDDPFALPDFGDEGGSADTTSAQEEDPFGLPDFDDSENNAEASKDATIDPVPVSAGLDFDGLYDKETKQGTPYQTNDDQDVRKKTKVPVIICVICAIICIIAVLLLLFIVPSKYNLLGKKNAKDQAAPVPVVKEEKKPEPEPEPEPEIPDTSAKEDEIVVITEPEVVETVVPEPPKEPEKPKTIKYKIKWGDTLWDIADAYYKNPWKYHMIARYNGIKNPDVIISGTWIELPQQ